LTVSEKMLKFVKTNNENDEKSFMQEILRETRVFITDILQDPLEAADFIFERGGFTRADYHTIDNSSGARPDRAKIFANILELK